MTLVVVCVTVVVDVVGVVVCDVVPLLVTVVVGDVVCELVGVVVVVGVLVSVEVTVLVCDVVCDEVNDVVVVGDVVGDVVALVVGVVTWQFSNPPLAKTVRTWFNELTALVHSSSYKKAPSTQAMSSSSPAGPRNSRINAFNESAVVAQSTLSVDFKIVSSPSMLQKSSP